MRSRPSRRTPAAVGRACAMAVLVALSSGWCVAAEPLPSWNDGAAKSAIVEFVERVTTPGAEDFIPEGKRIAVFDNDGTLWCENPVPTQLAYVVDELERRAPEEPELAADPMVQAALDGDYATLLAGKEHDGLLHVIGLTHMGMTTDEFARRVESWLETAEHPRFGVGYLGTVYQPMLEVLRYLRSKGFSTYIVSGGGADFMRVFSDEAYGISPREVIGSNALSRYELVDGVPTLTKTDKHLFVDDKEWKPVAIHQFIGIRPVMCFGNSDGDKAMLEYTTIGNPLPSLGVLLHHTDAVREYAYDSKPASSGRLVEALADAPDRGWVLIDMADDWKRVFPDGE